MFSLWAIQCNIYFSVRGRRQVSKIDNLMGLNIKSFRQEGLLYSFGLFFVLSLHQLPINERPDLFIPTTMATTTRRFEDIWNGLCRVDDCEGYVGLFYMVLAYRTRIKYCSKFPWLSDEDDGDKTDDNEVCEN